MNGAPPASGTEDLLRLAISRLALAAQGCDPQIDRSLDALRSHIRNALDPAFIRAELERITARLRDLDAPAGSAADERRAALGRVFEVIARPLELDAELKSRAETLRRQAEAASGDEENALLAEMAGLVAARIAQLKQRGSELQRFLARMGRGLEVLENQLARILASGSASLEDSRALGADVRGQVQGLSADLEQAEDPQALRQALEQRLSQLQKRVDAYCQRIADRSQALEAQVGDLKQRLRDLEQEGGRLRALLADERAAATTDALTGLPNRAAYERRIQQAVQRRQITGGDLALVVLDIDHFKRINDRYGHRAGDKALRLLARVMQAQLRDRDVLARYGGEEFVLILPGASLAAALNVAEKLRRAASEAPFHYRGERVPLSVSAGVAAFRPGEPADAAFERADAALYRAKRAGRNRCEAAD